jgi:transposase
MMSVMSPKPRRFLIRSMVSCITDSGRRAYDGEPVYDAVTARHPKAAVIIPPRTTSVPTETFSTQRDRHIAAISQHGRMNWQRHSGYNRRSLVETGMYRYKTVIGRRLHARTLPNQRTEAKVGCTVFNRMTGLGMPVTVRIP